MRAEKAATLATVPRAQDTPDVSALAENASPVPKPPML